MNQLLTPLMAAAAIISSPVYALTTKTGVSVAQLGAPATSISSGAEQQQKAIEASALTGPDLSSWRGDGRSGNVRRSDGKVTQVTPLRGNALSETAAGVTPKWCGARFQTGKAPAQSLVLVGVGATEALSCSAIRAFGAVPAPRGVERIAFVYSGSSPNASGVSTVVIVERSIVSAGSGWAINDELSNKFDERGNLTSIPAIRTYLSKANRH
jgi:hypothetical protein